jgi:hypothetical protein
MKLRLSLLNRDSSRLRPVFGHRCSTEAGAGRVASLGLKPSGQCSKPGSQTRPGRGGTGWKGSERRRQSKSCCLRWNETSESSVRSAMSIVETVLHRHKLRQERHGLEHRNCRTRRSLPAKHAAPDGAWTAPGVRFYKHATPTELFCPRLIPPETARNQIPPLCCQPGAFPLRACQHTTPAVADRLLHSRSLAFYSCQKPQRGFII